MAFLNTFDDEHLQAVVRLQALFAEAILPLLVKTALSLNNPAYNKELTQAVEIFFENYSKYIDEVCFSNRHLFCVVSVIKGCSEKPSKIS